MNMTLRHIIITFLILCGSGIFIATPLRADQQSQRIEEIKRRALDQAASLHTQEWNRLFFEYGGWLNYRFSDFNDQDNDGSTTDTLNNTQLTDLRWWLTATLNPPQDAGHQREHYFYLRLKDLYVIRSGDAPGARYDIEGPKVDYAYGILNYTPLWLETGRRYFNVGQGLAYSNVHDGIQLNYKIPGWNFGAFASKSLPHEDNIDTSVPGFDKKGERYFYGAGLGYAGIKNHTLYSYALVQRDESNDYPESATSDFTYNSEYYGLGAKGIFADKWNYWVELIKQGGESQIFNSSKSADIDAWGASTQLHFKPHVPLNPTIRMEYAFGSGDKDRTNVTDTEGGNTSGTDRNFLYFGYIDTGFALSPRLSNLHMFKAGFSLNPFERFWDMRNFALNFNFYRFLKTQSQGGISDTEATELSSDIGTEIDFEIDWQIASDLNLTLEYGYFMIGDAYPESADENESFFSASLTHTF